MIVHLHWGAKRKIPTSGPRAFLRLFWPICHHHLNVQKLSEKAKKNTKSQKKNNWVWRKRNIMTVVVSKDWISLLKMLKYGYFVAKGLKCPDRRGWHFPSQYPIVDLSKIPSAPSSIIYLKYFPIQTSKFLTLETLYITAIWFRRQLLPDAATLHKVSLKTFTTLNFKFAFDKLEQSRTAELFNSFYIFSALRVVVFWKCNPVYFCRVGKWNEIQIWNLKIMEMGLGRKVQFYLIFLWEAWLNSQS